MPRKIRPKWNWRGQESSVVRAGGALEAEKRDEIARMLGVTNDSALETTGAIDRLVEVYQSTKAKRDSMPSFNEQRVALEVAERHGRAFAKALQSLDALSRERLAHCAGANFTWARDPPELDPAELRRQDRGERRISDLISDIKQMVLWIERALMSIPADDAPGRHPNGPLEWLVRRLADLWEHCTGTPFDRRRKGSVTPRDFVETVILAVDPTVTGGNIDTAMRKEVARRKAASPGS